LIGDYLVVGCPYLASPKDFDTVLTHFSNKCEAVGKSPHKRILMCHQTPTQIFNSFIPADFNIDDPRLDIFDYVFIGHIHRYQGFGNNRFMVGNPIVQDAGDFGDRKGYLYLKDGLVQHVQLISPMDEIMVNVVDTRKQTVSKAEKVAHVDQRFYSDDFSQSFTAFCELAKLDQYTIEIGKKIISCQN
jgi:DNA repair exonuclease SbcCD nuclease subunit